MSSHSNAALPLPSQCFLDSKEERLDVLFNSGGLMYPPVEQTTKDGYDLQFGTNVLGPFLLTKLLLPAFLKGKASSPDGHARIIVTSSAYAYLGHLDFETFKDGPTRRKLSTEELYNQSKLADVLLAFELARRHGEQGIVTVALHPGILRTELTRHLNVVKRTLLVRPAVILSLVSRQ